MPTIHEVKAGMRGPVSGPEGVVDRIAAESKARMRRRVFIRTTVWLLLTAFGGFFVVVWQRNLQTIDEFVSELKAPAKAIQESVNQYGWLPVLPPDTGKVQLQYYCDNEAARSYAINAKNPVIIAFSRELTMVLKGRGRAVLIYDDGRVYPKWLSRPEFMRDWRQQNRAQERFEEKRRARPPELPQ
jgi:hypothetical protein